MHFLLITILHNCRNSFFLWGTWMEKFHNSLGGKNYILIWKRNCCIGLMLRIHPTFFYVKDKVLVYNIFFFAIVKWMTWSFFFHICCWSTITNPSICDPSWPLVNLLTSASTILMQFSMKTSLILINIYYKILIWFLISCSYPVLSRSVFTSTLFFICCFFVQCNFEN